MQEITICQIEERLRQLPPDKLAVVFDFVSYLAERQGTSESSQTVLTRESALHQDWKSSEDESEWLRAAATNPAFDFLKGPEEDIYTLADGKPFHDQK